METLTTDGLMKYKGFEVPRTINGLTKGALRVLRRNGVVLYEYDLSVSDSQLVLDWTQTRDELREIAGRNDLTILECPCEIALFTEKGVSKFAVS
jgi:hypothetical protein